MQVPNKVSHRPIANSGLLSLDTKKEFPFSPASIQACGRKPIADTTLQESFGKKLTFRALSLRNVDPQCGVIKSPKKVLSSIYEIGEKVLAHNLDRAAVHLDEQLEIAKRSIRRRGASEGVKETLDGMAKDELKEKILNNLRLDPEMWRQKISHEQLERIIKARIKENSLQKESKALDGLSGERPSSEEERSRLLEDNVIVASGCLSQNVDVPEVLVQTIHAGVLETLRFAPEMQTYMTREQIERIVNTRIKERLDRLKQTREKNHVHAEELLGRSRMPKELHETLLNEIWHKEELYQFLTARELKDLIKATKKECFHRAVNYGKAEKLLSGAEETKVDQRRLLEILWHKKEIRNQLTNEELDKVIDAARKELPVKYRQDGFPVFSSGV